MHNFEQPNVLDEIPDFIEHYPGLVDKEWCNQVIEYFNHVEKNSLTVTRELDYVKDTQFFVADLFNEDTEYKIMHAALADKYDAAMRIATRKYFRKYSSVLPASGKHSIIDYKIQKTRPGEGFTGWHYENSGIGVCSRFLTYMIYLNDIEEGGETEFFYQKRVIKPRAGDMLVWPAGFTHLHRGNKPLKETKYAITTWMDFVG